MSKDVKPKIRIGQSKMTGRKRILAWAVLLTGGGGGGYAAYQRLAPKQTVEIPAAKVRRGEFIISVRTRGELRSTNSIILAAPQVPDPRIVKLAESGRPIKKGDVVVEFDAASQEQYFLERTTSVRTVDSEIINMKASQRIIDEMDGMNLMTAQYNVERSKLEASKAEVVSEIEGAKSRIDVGISQGQLGQVETTIKAHDISQQADLARLEQKKDKMVRDMDRAKGYLSKMVIRAPLDGIVTILPNFRSQGNFGSAPPPFKEGDRAWTGAAIGEIPDLTQMRIELKMDEVDRGKLQIGYAVRIRVDALPEKEFEAELDWLSPIASVIQRGPGSSEKTFPARATMKSVDPRLRPGMSATAEILIESQANAMLIPARASIVHRGKPAVYLRRGQGFEIRPIEVGKRNENEIVVLKGLRDGDEVYLENPVEAARRAKKL